LQVAFFGYFSAKKIVKRLFFDYGNDFQGCFDKMLALKDARWGVLNGYANAKQAQLSSVS
jgi:hypothetical protein